MTTQKLTLLRLQKQQKKLQQQPIPNVLVARDGLLNFHFCIYNLGDPYQGGYYHGVLQLHSDYPFSPPRLVFYTPSGRFETNKSICTTFTNFHKETWTSAWNVRTMLTATVSFMTEESQGAIGSIKDGYALRKKYAAESLKWNLKQQTFKRLFQSAIRKNSITISQDSFKNQKIQKSIQPQQLKAESSNGLYILYAALFAVCILWAVLKAQQ